jgi:ABC-2 type transport system permease protein
MLKMTIIKREWAAHRKSMLIWVGVIWVFAILMFMEFSAYYQNDEMSAVLDAFPKAMLDAFGMYGANLTTVNGYLSIMVLYFNIMLAIYAVLLGSSIILKEKRDRTAEFLFSMPIKRIEVLASKMVAAVTMCILMTVMTALAFCVSIIPYEFGSEQFRYIVLISSALFLIELVFLGLGLMIGALVKRHKWASGIAVSLVCFSYFLYIVESVSDSLEFLKFFTPFKYFEGNTLLQDGYLDLGFMGIVIGLFSLALSISFYVYPKRDI